jgi:signal transduction histidine kinase/CheY-like chemotaxis protein/sensor domain CHASE-containing protein
MSPGATTPHDKVNKRAALVSLLACAVVASLFALLFTQVRAGEQRAYRTQMDTLASEKAALLRSRLASATQVLDTLVSLWEVDLVSSRQDFAVFARRALPEHPELRAIEWVPRVNAADKAAYERAARDDGYADYASKDFEGGGGSPPGREVFPVYYVEPVRGNEGALGVDLASDQERRAAMERARDSGRATATGIVHLVQGRGGDPGFLVFAPVYCRAASVASIDGRRRALQGFVTGAFRFEDLARAAIADPSEDPIAITLVDAATGSVVGPMSDRAFAIAGAGQEDGYVPPPRPMEIAGRLWDVRLSPIGKRLAPVHLHSRWLMPIGVGCTLLFGAYLFAAVRRTVEIERRVRERTAKLSSEIATRAEVERSLARARDALEARVIERTAELARSNLALQEEISVRKGAEQEAARANDAKSVFLASMSHEIRTPLNAILGYAQILQADPSLPVTSLGAVHKIASSGGHLLGLLSEILDLSQIEAGRTELRRAEFDLGELLVDVGVLFENQCSKKSLEFRLEGFPARGTRVLGDASKLRQILINLAENAVKFTSCGSVHLRLEAVGADRYVFEVTDTGLGIPDGAFDAILLPFHQEVAGRTIGGTGLGLAIARRYAELMEGKLAIQSRIGQGSTFSLSVRLPPAPFAAERAEPGEGWKLAPGCRVVALVVDDVSENREVLATMLAALGCEVWSAESGREALACASRILSGRDLRTSIVFLDVRMPDLDGPAVVKCLRDGPIGAIRIVAQSASALAHEQAQYRQCGFDDFLAKPVSYDGVRACLGCLPGVEFERSGRSPTLAEPPTSAAPTPLPNVLRERIRAAALVHNATGLRSCFREVEELGPAQRPHLDLLRRALQSYDMQAIVTAVSSEAPH